MRNLRVGVSLALSLLLAACGDGSSGAAKDRATGGSSTSGGSSSGGETSSPEGGSAGSAVTGGGSSVSSAGSSSTAAPIAVQDLCPVFTSDLCSYLIQCNQARYRDLSHCKQELDCFGMKELLDSSAKGRVHYDATKVGACHERFIASPCTFGFFLFTPDIFEVLAFCPGTLTPNQTEGGECVSDGECKDNLYCYKGANYQCPGVCKKRGQSGDSCANNARCDTAFTCGTGNICVPKPKAGDSCVNGCSYSVTCVGTDPCPGNIWCDESSQTCQSGRLAGEACGYFVTGSTSYRADCAINLWCNGLGSTQGTCQRLSNEGGTCVSSRTSCTKGLHCVGAVEYGTGSKLGTCTGPAAIGSTCSQDADCQSGLVCNASVCANPGLSGIKCDSDSDCANGLICASNACVVARYPGDTCNTTNQPCVYSRCVNGACQVHAHVGEACTVNADCATSQCVNSICYDSSVCNTPI